jgi:hypothetical protein
MGKLKGNSGILHLINKILAEEIFEGIKVNEFSPEDL